MGLAVKVINTAKVDRYTRRISLFNRKAQKVCNATKQSNSYLNPVERYLLDYYKEKYNFKQQKPVQWALKRVIDYVGASAGILLTSPIMLLEAAAIKLESKGPVIFKQTRIGKGGKLFTIYKFRTMYNDLSKEGIKDWAYNKHRVTKVGKVLRKFSLDEFPQFINILKGDMSLVGPRPYFVDNRSMLDIDNNTVRRYAVLPGAKLNYSCVKDEDIEKNILIEKDYLENWNLKKDIKILGCIIKDVVSGHNC